MLRYEITTRPYWPGTNLGPAQSFANEFVWKCDGQIATGQNKCDGQNATGKMRRAFATTL
jgi:hypothetical protein